MNLLEDAIIVNLKSQDAITYNNSTYLSDVVFLTNGLIKHDYSIHHIEVSVLNCQIPCTFYNISNINNVLNYTVNAVNYSITITPSNYTFNTLQTQMQSLFLANGHSVAISYNQNLGTTSFLFSGATYALSFLSSSTASSVLGFSASVNGNTNTSLAMPYPLNLYGALKLKIFSSFLGTRNYDSSGASCLMTLPITSSSFGLISYENCTNHRNILKANFVDKIDIKITDEKNNLLNFNNVPWAITLRLGVFYYYTPNYQTFHDVLNGDSKIISHPNL